MPPKSKDTAKKPALQIARPAISNASLLHVPEDAVEGYQDRIETGVSWTLVEDGARYHKRRSLFKELPRVTFSEGLRNKTKLSILDGFLDESSSLTLDEQWELLLPITLWDNEKFASDEGKVCFNNINCITDDMVKLIRRAVRLEDREVLKNDLKMVEVLRVNDSQMTELDDGLTEFVRLVTLNLCGNFLCDIDGNFIPPGVRSLELQANRFSKIEAFAKYLPANLLYLGLSRNLLTNDSFENIAYLPHHISVLDLSDNDIYQLDAVLDAVIRLPSLVSLQLAGNPCSVCAAYARTTLMRLPHLRWLDSREIMVTDRSVDPFEPHPDDLRSAYFNFSIFRIMSAVQPPKPEKGATTTFHVELELPLLDSTRRAFLMFRHNESLIEMQPLPEDDEWQATMPSSVVISKALVVENEEALSHESDIYRHLTAKNSREICHFTTFESNRVQWNKVMTFQEPAVKIFCPDLIALRDTFRSVITLRLIYSVTITAKQGKADKKSANSLKMPTEQRVTLATIRCSLKRPDWSQPSQHFHWDDSLGSNDALHWGDGDLSVLQYAQVAVKPTKTTTKTKPDADVGPSRQNIPDNLTCHFGFGIDTLHA